MTWDCELCEIMDIPISILPQVKSSSEVFGYTQKVLTSDEIPISGIAGDQQAALFGQMCTEPGMVKNTYGTGCFMLMNTGEKPVTSQNNLLTTIAWKINGKVTYALEGSVFIAGAAVQWLRDGLKIIRHAHEVEPLALSLESNEGVYFVPSFTGLGAPYWAQEASGLIVGLTRGTTQAHIARAALESIAFQTMDVLKSMESDSHISIKELRVDGGATVNNFLMQFQSDILDCQVVRPSQIETTAQGAAYLAGLAVGYWSNIDDIQQQWEAERTFGPHMTDNIRQRLSKEWHNAIHAVLSSISQ